MEMLEAEANVKDKKEGEENKTKIGWCTVLSNRYAMFALLCIYWGTYNIIFGEAILEKYFIMMGDEDLLGTAYLVQGFFYLVTCISLPYTCEHSPRRLQFFLAFIGFGICQMMIGPSNLFGLYESDWSQECEFEGDAPSGVDCRTWVETVTEADLNKYEFVMKPRVYVVSVGVVLMGFF